jgi:hypothetical protein
VEQPLSSQPVRFNEDGVVSTIINIQGLPLPMAGDYLFQLMVDDS